MKFKKSQSGRSMVEMLGVLAIIGVLSVGGIAGYSLSMRRHRANGVVDLASKYALVVYSNCQQKLLNNQIGALSNCTSEIQASADKKLPTFSEAGVGPLPAGVTSFASANISSNQTTGVDNVALTIEFSDLKLCQAVASIVGSTCNDANGSYYTFIDIKQN